MSYCVRSVCRFFILFFCFLFCCHRVVSLCIAYFTYCLVSIMPYSYTVECNGLVCWWCYMSYYIVGGIDTFDSTKKKRSTSMDTPLHKFIELGFKKYLVHLVLTTLLVYIPLHSRVSQYVLLF